MSFFYRSHTRWQHGFHFGYKIFYYAAMYAIPNPNSSIIGYFKKRYGAAKKQKQAIGENIICKKRTVPSVSLHGSLTVEAALALPIFIGAILLLAGLLQALSVYEQVNRQLCTTGRKMAAYSEAYDGNNAADVYRLFYMDPGYHNIEQDRLVGGYAGIMLNASLDEDSGVTELKAVYRIRVPGYLIAGRDIPVTDSIYVRAWLGGEPETVGQSGELNAEQVYVAENGVVYHNNEACTYLKLSVHQCLMSTVQELRNEYGMKYIPCERCVRAGGNGTIYITDTGRAWHADRQCSGLKRQLRVVDLEEAKRMGLRPCPRCGR